MLKLNCENIKSYINMTRWTEEEDQHIFILIQDLSIKGEEPIYEDMVEEHNLKFEKERTEATYRVRLRKIAKEHNIALKTNNHWTDDDKKELVRLVHEQSLVPNWSEIAIKLKRQEPSVRQMYTSCVSPITQVLYNTDVINLEMIETLMSTMSTTCCICSKKEYTNPYVWKGLPYCQECYNEQFGKELQERWSLIHEYSISKGKASCNLCNKNAIFNNSIMLGFHYDHLDMFDKSYSVCEIVRTGMVLEEAYGEIDKCQLLCISCHRLITQIEHQSGFIRLKRDMNSNYKDEQDDSKRKEIVQEYSKIYSTWMEKIYSILRSQSVKHL
jgi:hypothetical protein